MKQQTKTIFWLGLIAVTGIFAYSSYLKRNPIEKDVDYDKDIIDKVETIVVEKPVSEYLGNKLENGASPYDVLYGQSVYAETRHSLKIINNGSTDVIVMLIEKTGDKMIRNEYVQAKSEYEMTKIPNSLCYTKYYYGRDWNPNRKTKGIVTGGFDNDEQFVISDKDGDILTFQVTSDEQYTYSSNFEITLETQIIEGKAMQERSLKPSEFF
ncbi:hypothetical protein [Arenibacter latericius]|uniref:hypothetical protein n=1 Tax=Arenibacter latericius TaxID=86104 RepID=UPI000411DD16|nr:hypothetical protein [Arenibacter latericius]